MGIFQQAVKSTNRKDTKSSLSYFVGINKDLGRVISFVK